MTEEQPAWFERALQAMVDAECVEEHQARMEHFAEAQACAAIYTAGVTADLLWEVVNLDSRLSQTTAGRPQDL